MPTIRALIFSSLYPNAAAPNFGVFVENRTRRLAESGQVRVQVLAPVLIPPPPLDRHPRYAALAGVPPVETRHGLVVHHPRVPIVPGVGWRLNPWAMTRWLTPFIAKLHDAHRFDLIDAHFFYPDGVAATRIGRRLGVPVSVTARGADITMWPHKPFARAGVLEAGRSAASLAAVCQSLADDMAALGMDRSKIVVLRNGVDLEHFQPLDRAAARQRHGVSGPFVVSVGALIPRKGHHLTIEAVAALPGVQLAIAGAGPEQAALEARIAASGAAERIRLLGPVPHGDLPALYNAADLSVLASFHEGMANVLLESIACGTAVVATRIDGAPEVLEDPRAGVMVPVGDVGPLRQAIADELARPRDRTSVRASAERFRWADTTAAQIAQFKAMAAANRSG